MTKPKADPALAGLTTERVPLDQLELDPENVRIHGQKSLDGIASSLRRFGQRTPIVVDARGRVLKGNGTLAAARLLEWTHLDVVRTELSGPEARAYAIADNAVGLLSEWDVDGLVEQLKSFGDDGLEGTGFTAEDLKELGRSSELAGPASEDEAPTPPKQVCSRTGDLWLLGEHRLLCGDGSSEADVERLMQGERATVVFTDPPWGVDIAAKNRFLDEHAKAGMSTVDLSGDAASPEKLSELLVPCFMLLRTHVLAEDGTLMLVAPQGGELGPMMMMMMMRDAGLPVRHMLIWKKNAPTFSMGRLDYDYQHEPILLTWGKRHQRPMRGAHKSSVWEVDKPRSSPDHATTKPVALYENAYLNHSEDGDVVADLFGGSGTCLSAAEQTKRKARVMEVLPPFVDVCVARWQTLTGRHATLDGDGRTFAEVHAERSAAQS